MIVRSVQAAKGGEQDSQFNLAYYYTVGKGVRRHLRKAAYWLLQAAQQVAPVSPLRPCLQSQGGEGGGCAMF